MATLKTPPMVYIKGEEMTRVVMALVLEKWFAPYMDISLWKTFDLSCKNRDATDDRVLKDAIEAGAKIGAIFKEPTVTATADQMKSMGLSKPQGSPNGKMREGWNGFSIDRDTIMIPGLEKMLGYKKPVLFCRHAVGGEYGASSAIVGAGKLKMTFIGADGKEAVIGERVLKDHKNAIVMYHNPLDNVEQLAHHFFQRSLEAGVTPYIVTKKTVFKWQEPFWEIMKTIFDRDYKAKFMEKELLVKCGGELRHLLSDDAAMKLVSWKEGGVSVVAHNYDGDWLTDELAIVHKSPAFISSVLTGIKANGQIIKEFEASHGTIADQYAAYIKGVPTSVNPLGMVDALCGAIKHASKLAVETGQITLEEGQNTSQFADTVYKTLCEALAEGRATRDLSPENYLTTEQFIDEVAERLRRKISGAQSA